MPEDVISPQASSADGTPTTKSPSPTYSGSFSSNQVTPPTTINNNTPTPQMGSRTTEELESTTSAEASTPSVKPTSTPPSDPTTNPSYPATPMPSPTPAFSANSQAVNSVFSNDGGNSSGGLTLEQPVDDRPVPVIKVYSVKGVEYLFMTLALWFSAASLVGILLAIINGAASFDILAFPLSLLIVSLPIFGFFFLRLRKAELLNPQLRLEASKRRLSQITQVISFIVCVSTIVALLNVIFASIAGSYGGMILKAFLNALVILLVAGGLLVYYWFDEHRLVK